MVVNTTINLDIIFVLINFMITHVADRLLEKIDEKGNPCCVGLDPVVERIPHFLLNGFSLEDIADMYKRFCFEVIDVVYDLVPAIKPQIAFFEKLGWPGLKVFQEVVIYGKKMGLFVVEDGKRGDIGSTSQAYAEGHLGKVKLNSIEIPSIDVDMLTVNPYLGNDSIEPFANICKTYGKGIFVLVKTSNPGSGLFQDRLVDITESEKGEFEKLGLKVESKTQLYNLAALQVSRLAQQDIGKRGYSSIGAVVGATYPEQARILRDLMPYSINLVPGYGAQGATGEDIIPNFNSEGYGALVNSSRGITYAYLKNKGNFLVETRHATQDMIKDITSALERHGLRPKRI